METSMSTQSVQLETKLLSQISSQFQHMMSVQVQNNQVAAPIPECHTDNISTGISTLTPTDSKDK